MALATTSPTETTSRLTDSQVEQYHRDGFIGVNGVFSPDEVDELRRVTEDYVQQSADLTDHNEMFDLDFAAGHSRATPKLRRIKNPHTLHPVYEAASMKQGLLDIIEQPDRVKYQAASHQAEHEGAWRRRPGRMAYRLGLLSRNER